MVTCEFTFRAKFVVISHIKSILFVGTSPLPVSDDIALSFQLKSNVIKDKIMRWNTILKVPISVSSF